MSCYHVIASFLCFDFTDNATPDQQNDFLEEINLMKAVGSHKNILSLIGCCTKSSPNFLVVEFASDGDLLSYLRERRKRVRVYAYTVSRQRVRNEEESQSNIDLVSLV